MKKYIPAFALIICALSTVAQNNNTNSILVRHDTTLLKAAECEWIIKSLTKNDPALTSSIGKQVPLVILEAIKKGKLKAIDVLTDKHIPAKDIFTWNLPADTTASYDDAGKVRYFAVQRQHIPEKISQIRIFQDWYLDIATGKFRSEIKWIELLEEVYTSSGIFLGYSVLCRIYY